MSTTMYKCFFRGEIKKLKSKGYADTCPFFMKFFGEPDNKIVIKPNKLIWFAYENKTSALRPCKSAFSDRWGVEYILFFGILDHNSPNVPENVINDLINKVGSTFKELGVDSDDIISSVSIWDYKENEPVYFKGEEEEYSNWLSEKAQSIN